ncbi:MAG: N-acetyltransferase [Rhizobiales bacterium]|nr:N-acetyltransferase [Hyphomicrobiales bacterium]
MARHGSAQGYLPATTRQAPHRLNARGLHSRSEAARPPTAKPGKPFSVTSTFALADVTPGHAKSIEHLLDLSFGLSRRTKTSYRLREGNTAVPGLSLVAAEHGFGLVGCISFWPIFAGNVPALLLGPIAVHPQRQNLGIGLALMREGLSRAKSQGHRIVLLVGDEPYYARVGFARIPDGKLLMPGPVDPKRLLFLELAPECLAAAKGLVLPPHRHAALARARS